ncbi:DUF3327 domain-containing protein [Paenalcaligenes niemegkensis]|uniref:enterochelin esterase domain-containing protein n=1 Tax=Paenalcaligenes niemegkensis TaxID=2895469 RepID=UPI001EE9436C|nr:alpha/beta hydrolase-fold protein [Paenalcaligenes niemegkensis]MCQ9617598.1 DUF3327 domain-containing protein [Paenalcaligenes niemegkensis]
MIYYVVGLLFSASAVTALLPAANASSAEYDQITYVQQGELVIGEWQGPFESTLSIKPPSGPLRELKRSDYETGSFFFQASESGVHRLSARGMSKSNVRITERYENAATEQHEVDAEYSVLSSPALRKLFIILNDGGSTDAFWAAIESKGTPLVEPYDDTHKRVSFLWRGDHQNVRLFGGPSNEPVWMQRLGQSDVWFATFILSSASEFSYQIAPDVPAIAGASPAINRRLVLATAQADPLNPHSFPDNTDIDPYQRWSVLRLADAPPRPALAATDAKAALSFHRLHSKFLANEREIAFYRSSSSSSVRQLLILLDLGPYLSRVNAPAVLSGLEEASCIPATDMILVGNPSSSTRSKELPPNPDFASFVAKELLPYAASHGIAAPAERTIIAGSSFGGLAASYVAQSYAQHIPNVISLSGSYWWAPKGEEPEWTNRSYQQSEALPVRFFLSAGEYEGARPGHPGILESNQRFYQTLKSKGYDVQFVHFYGGHDYYNWQELLARGLQHFSETVCAPQ